MDLFKTFDCVPHDLLLGKLAVSWVDESFLCYIHPFFLNRKQYVRINNINSGFVNVITGAQQGTVVGPILFNCFFDDVFYVIETANVYNFADHKTLTAFANNIQILKHLLETAKAV